MHKRMSLLQALIIVVLAATALAPGAASPASAAPLGQAGLGGLQDVTYCTADGVNLKMDIYPPLGQQTGPSPAAIFVHGGGWTQGDKSSVGPEALLLRQRGYLVASINYRLAPLYKFPAQIEDTKCSVRYLRANAAKYNIDPNRIVAWGASAGGHLVSLLGVTDPSAGFEGNGGYQDQLSRVRAVVDMFGPADLDAPEYAMVRRGLVATVFGTSEMATKAGPVNYVTPDDPPFLILQGDQDVLVPLAQSQEFYDKLVAGGVPATLVVVKNAGHGFQAVGGPISPTLVELGKMIADFFDRSLGIAPGTSAPPSSQSRTFPETGKTVSGRFLQYWNNHGGLAQQGYPISNEMQEKSLTDGKVYTVQYFERAVFELHPENAAPNDVLLSLLGAQRYASKYPAGAPNQVPDTSAGSVLFAETGHRVGGRFLQYWQTHGGLAQQGYPVSDVFTEVSDLDGKPYTVQYFQRAVFEYHPENQAPNDVLLSQLGTFQYKARYGGTSPTP